MPRSRAPRRAVVTFLAFALMTIVLALGGARCAAHPANFASAGAKIQSDRAFTVQVRFDLLAFVLDDTPYRIGDGPMNALLDGPSDALQAQLTEAQQRFRTDFQVSGGAVDTVAFPTVADVHTWRDSGIRQRLPVMQTVTMSGHLDPGAKTVAFRFPSVLGMVVLTTEVPYQEPISEPLDPGAISTPVDVTPGAPPTPMVVTAPPSAVDATQKKPTKASSIKSIQPAPKLNARQTKMAAMPMTTKATPPKTPPNEHPQAGTPPTSTAVHLRGLQSLRPINNSLQNKDLNPRRRVTVLGGANSFAGSPSLGGDLRTKPHSRTMAVAQTPAPANIVPIAAPPMAAKPSAAIAAVAAIAPAAPPAEPIASPRPNHWLKNLVGYVKMGFTHILPEGLDHILFVLGLFLLSTKLKPLLWQITAFTVAHSLTLGLALYGVVRLPSSIIEPIIAASIAFVAVENICTTELKPWRPFVVFAFGLVHGMGFAGALKDLGLHRSDFLTALVGFNVGVEMGQLSVVALAFLCVGWLRSRPDYRKIVVVPASALIAVVAVFWTIQRVLA